MKKMIYILGFYPINGRSLKISKALKEYNDVEIKFIYWNRTGLKILEKDKNDYIFTENKKLKKVDKLISIYSFYKFIKKIKKEYKPDIIFAYHWDIFIISKLLRNKEKIIYDISDIPGYTGILQWMIKKIEQFFLKKDDFLIFASRFFIDFYPKNKLNEYIVIDNKLEKYHLKNYKNNKNDKINIGFAGVYRNFDILKNIIDIVENKNEFNLYFYGEGNIEKELEAYCKMKNNIYIVGRYNYEDIPKIYSNIDIVLSLYSNKDLNTKLATGNKFFKVQAFKKIGIFPKDTKMGDLIEKKNIGLVIDPYNKNELNEILNEILKNSEKIRKIRKNLELIDEKDIFWEYEEKKLKGILN